jgi:hypothetical protein
MTWTNGPAFCGTPSTLDPDVLFELLEEPAYQHCSHEPEMMTVDRMRVFQSVGSRDFHSGFPSGTTLAPGGTVCSEI